MIKLTDILNEVRRFQQLAGLTEGAVERQLLSTKPGDKIELTLDDDTKQLYVRVGTNSQNEPTFKMLKNDKPVSRESALAVSFIKAVKPISTTRQMTGDPDVDFMGEVISAQPNTYDYNNPGDEWKNIFTKAMERFNKYPNNSKVKKDITNVLIAAYKLGFKKAGKKQKPEDLQDLANNLVTYDRQKVIRNGSADDLITYIKNDVDPTLLPNWADPRAQKDFKAGNWIRITPQTKLKVGNEIVRMGDIWFGEIAKIEGDKFFIRFDADYADEKPTKKKREQLEDYYLLIKR